jgi:hypothetical protein
MIANPAIVALTAGAVLTAASGLFAAGAGLTILRGWDRSSGAEDQLARERRTELVSVILARTLPFQFLSFFLFIHTADRIHALFPGAMCAAGTLNAGAMGYPVLALKMVNLILCGLWLVLDHLDRMAPDFPLIRPKYRFLVGPAALLVLEAVWQYRFFAGLRPNVITSCCGSLFGANAAGIGGEIAGLPPRPVAAAFFAASLAAFASGVRFLFTGRGARTFSRFCGIFAILAMISLVSFISVYFYQLPTHRCPFCILQREYGHVGYPLYLGLLAAAIPGMGVGLVDRMARSESPATAAPRFQRRLCAVALAGVALFVGTALYPMATGDFVYLGY